MSPYLPVVLAVVSIGAVGGFLVLCVGAIDRDDRGASSSGSSVARE